MLRKTTFVFTVLLLTLVSLSQNIKSSLINGSWQGILLQSDGPYTDNFAYWVSLTVNGDSVIGIARTEAAGTPFYALINLKGKINKNRISFIQDKIIKNNPRPQAAWCLIKGELVYNSADNTISGDWDSNMSKCTPGSILLCKSPKSLNMGATLMPVYSTFKEVEIKLKKKKNVNGYKVILTKITFEKNSSKTQGDAASEINDIYDLIMKNSTLHVNIEGHTDNTGSDDVNMKLSYLRAKEIYDLLLAKGIDASRITYEGYGKSRPIASNEAEDGKFKNRRVEIQIEITTD